MVRPSTPPGRRPRLGLLAAVCLLGLLLAAAPATAQSAAPLGYDISYPLCGMPYPGGQAFGIVGVNAGLANNPNPCLPAELAWAAASPGLSSPAQPAASLYVNAADPGNGVPDWPSPANGTATASTPFGTCDGSWSQACGYLYGVERAVYDYQLVAAAATAVAPATAAWWLDIETTSSWATPTRQASWAALNVATIEGFVGGLQASGATGRVGFYSTQLQWLAITGLTPQASPQQFPASSPDWVAGVGTVGQAALNCAKSFSGAPVTLAQFSAGGLDADYACPAGATTAPAAAAGLRVTSHKLTRTQLTLTGSIAPTYRGHVEVELDETYRGRAATVRKAASTARGGWTATLRLPSRFRGHVSAATVSAMSGAQDGLKAGRARLVIHLPR
ncbi:MAG TPA: hypothetical protein VHW26_05525 [Solirubrobacteraceae bacterium]|jgi:hypothetical protein|nr:hypothetical protein [Solirubrobacteraceae bacterium]